MATAPPPAQRARHDITAAPIRAGPPSLANLPPYACAAIACHLPTSALLRVAALAKGCRADFLAEITAIRLRPRALREDPPRVGHDGLDEDGARRQVKVLATLLRRMPKLTTIDAGSDPTLHEVLGRALIMLKRRGKVTHINLSLHGVLPEEEEDDDDDDDDDDEVTPPPHALAKALAYGCLPGIRYLDLSAAGWGCFMCRKANLLLLRKAIENGHLPCLRDIKLESRTIIHALRTSFDLRCPRRAKKRHERAVVAAAAAGTKAPLPLPHQAWVDRLVVVTDTNTGSTRKLLALPAFGRLHDFRIVLKKKREYIQESLGLETVTDYFLFTGGAPCLRALEIADGVTVTSAEQFAQALAQTGGGGDLERLKLECISLKVLRELGHVYLAGGLSGLTDIDISSYDWGLRSSHPHHSDFYFWYRAVVQSKHKGASVEWLRVGWVTPDKKYREEEDVQNNRDTDAFQALDVIFNGLREGAFPSLQCLDLPIAEPRVDLGRELGQALIDALKGGACTKTLRSVDMHGTSEAHVREVEALLPEGAIVS